MKSQINCILLIDDDQAINQYHETLINKAQMVSTVALANSATEGLAYINKCMLEAKPYPNIIFLDIHMPELSGWDFLDKFKQLNLSGSQPISIYMVTTSENPDDSVKAKITPEITGLLPKPLDLEALKNIFSVYQAGER